MTHPVVEAGARAFIVTCMKHRGRRPSPEEIASFRGFFRAALRVESSAPPPFVNEADDIDEPTRPSRPYPRPGQGESAARGRARCPEGVDLGLDSQTKNR